MSTCTPWATTEDAPCEAADFVEGRLQKALDLAGPMIDRATLGLYGVCEDIIRPCSDRAMSSPWNRGATGWPWPTWSNTGDIAGLVGLCSCTGDDVQPCGCTAHSGLTLPLQPVRTVDEVLIDGVEVDDVVIVDGRVILRGDGLAWPCCQHLERDPSEIGTWQVSYSAGADVPADGVIAVASLACEFAKAWAGGAGCRLPRRVTSVVSEGITVAMAIDSLDIIRQGWFGVPEVDGFIASVNPNRLQREPRWLSVDTLAEPRRVTPTTP